MNINAAIIDQRLGAIVEQIRDQAKEEIGIFDDNRLKSLSFVFLCVKTMLDLSDEETFDCLTEGSGDFGVDAIHLSEEYDGEFTVTLFQGKYKHNIEGNSNFEESAIILMVRAIQTLFNPSSPLGHVNLRLKTKVEEIRSLIRDGYIPQVRALACNNGLKWNESAEEEILRSNFGEQVSWEHVNHDRLVKILQSTKTVNGTLKFSGDAIVEDFNYSRVFVGRIPAEEIAALIERHGERLLERNVRRYLGLQGNRVNEAIRDTLLGNDSNNFYFYNNGITLTCDNFSYNAIQKGDYIVNVENLQIINGGQTCMTIFKTMKTMSAEKNPNEAFVLVRLYQLPSDNNDLVNRITFATNNQTPVDLYDLRSNDEIQRRLELDISQFDYKYIRNRTELRGKKGVITPRLAAEAILSVWLERPHQARSFFFREYYAKLYDTIFTDDLNGAQVIIASTIFLISDKQRRKEPEKGPTLVGYASSFIAMQMGKYLLSDMGCSSKDITHKRFQEAMQLIEKNSEDYYFRAIADIEKGLRELYGKPDVSMQQLSATFRRGDLLEILKDIN